MASSLAGPGAPLITTGAALGTRKRWKSASCCALAICYLLSAICHWNATPALLAARLERRPEGKTRDTDRPARVRRIRFRVLDRQFVKEEPAPHRQRPRIVLVRFD